MWIKGMRRKGIFISLVLVVSTGVGAVRYFRGAETNDAAPNDNHLRQTVGHPETISPIDPKRQERYERRKRRQESVAGILNLLVRQKKEGSESKKFRDLVKDASISKEELHKIQMRDDAIESHIWTEGASVYNSMIGEQDQDIDWTEAAITAIGDILKNQPTLNSTIVELKCYDTLCRGVFRHDDQRSMGLFRDVVEESAIEGPSQGFIRENEDGSVETTVYFARAGDDALLIEEMHDRLYEKVTGQSVETIGL